MRVRFGDVIFDGDARRVLRGGTAVHLSGKAFDLLALLLERRPTAVSKHDIRERLWPETFVSDANQPALVAEIRDAIGDNAREPRFIRTLHGFGYAFIGEAADADPPVKTTREAAAWLVAADRRIAVFPGENVLGREGPGVTVIDSTTVSRRHVRIVIDEGTGTCTLEDLGSKNGTFVNDERVAGSVVRPLADGDRVRLGSLLFTFRTRPGATSTETQSSTVR